MQALAHSHAGWELLYPLCAALLHDQLIRARITDDTDTDAIRGEGCGFPGCVRVKLLGENRRLRSDACFFGLEASARSGVLHPFAAAHVDPEAQRRRNGHDKLSP